MSLSTPGLPPVDPVDPPAEASHGVRGQATLIAVVVIAFTLLSGGAVMLGVLGASLRSGVEQAQRARVADASVVVTTEGIDALSGPEGRRLAAGGPLQLVDPTLSGAAAVRYASTSEFDVPASSMAPAPGVVLVDRRAVSSRTGDRLVLVAQGVEVGGHAYVIVAGGSLAATDRALRQDALSLVVGVPLLSVLGGWAVWILVGRTLRPVEELRRAVEEIGAADLRRRLPVPPGQDVVSRLAETMNAMLARIEHAQASQRRFVADASHELRSPVAAFGAGLEILGKRPEELPAVLPLLVTETEHLASLTDGLLVLARADAGMLRRRRVDVDMDDIVGSEVVRLRTSSPLRVQAHVEAARVVGEPEELHRVVRNLVDNAARAARSRLGLSVVREGDEAVVRVDDDGPGIPAEERDRVFERFVRLDADRGRDHGGAGLGLPIVHSIVQAHGGTVTVGESPWGGARFEVRLPGAEGGVPETPEE